jgi:lipopolysaccharide heptosyltransferase II
MNERILALCPIGIGNFLLVLPALRHLKDKKPDAHLALLCLKPEIFQLTKRYPFIDEALLLDPENSKAPLAIVRLLGKIKMKFDRSIAFFPSNRLEYNILPFLARVKERIGFRYHHRGWIRAAFLNTRLVPVSKNQHDLLQNFTPLSSMGIMPPATPEMLSFPLAENEKLFALDYLKQHNPEGLPLIGLHPGSSSGRNMDKKRWPFQSFAALAQRVLNGKQMRFLVFGGPEEQELKKTLAACIGPAADAVETGSLGETAALISRCQRFISNDSGLMHLAASFGIKTCGIFGPTDDTRTAPFGKGHLIIRQDLECSPCWTIQNVGRREFCKYGDFRCLGNLEAKSVYEKIWKWLEL